MPVRPSSARRALSAVFAACALLSGCATGAGLDPPDGGTDGSSGQDAGPTVPTTWVGGSCDNGTGFLDWADDAQKPRIIMGIQGGQHIWVSIRARHVHPKKLRMGVEMRLADTGELVKPGRVEITTSLKADGDWLLYAGMPAFVKEPCKIMGKKVHVKLDVSDLYGVKAQDEAFITPTWDGFCPGETQPPVPAPPPQGHCLTADGGATADAGADGAGADAAPVDAGSSDAATD